MNSGTLNRFFITVLIFIGAFVPAIVAQVSPSFRHYTTEDGLPSSEVYFVLQDSKGNVWFGTDRGVARYDGYEFRTFTYKDGLTDNTVFKMFEDKKGRVWMLTYSCRLFYEDGNKIHPYKFNDRLFQVADNRVPLGLYIDSLENVIVSVIDLGEINISSKGEFSQNLVRENFPDINYVIHRVESDKLLVSNLSMSFKGPSVKIIYYDNGKIESINIEGIAGERFSALGLDGNRLLICPAKLLYEKSGKSIRLVARLPERIFTLFKDSRKNLWVGTEDGVYLFDGMDFSKPPYHYLVHSNVTSILQDHEGGYWFGTLNNGIFYVPGYGIAGIPFNRDLFQKPTSLATDYNSSVYVGCWNGALARIQNGQTKIVFFPENESNLFPVTKLSSFHGDEKIYLSRSIPGYFYRGKFYKFKSQRTLGIKTEFLKMSTGELFSAGTRFIFENQNDSLILYSVFSQRISCLEEMPDHRLIFGSNIGAFVVDHKTKETSLLRSELDNIRVDDMKWMGKDILFATKGKGILILSNDSVYKIDESNGLSSNLVNKLLVNGNEVWCASNKGLSRIVFIGPSPAQYSITNIQSNDGLFSDEVNDIVLLNDTLYVATNSGISFFNIRTDFVNHKEPPVYISSLHVNNDDISLGGALEFSHEKNNMQISFNGISYRSNKKIKYQYRLITGKDTISSYTSNREVEFLTLSPGKYTFQVAAMNNSGIWSSKPAEFFFTILPAWWQTWTFRVMVALLITSIIYILYKNKLKQLRHDFEIEKRQATLQLTAMRAQMNPHFIFNVMNSIRNYMLNHDMKSAQKYLTSFSKLIRYVLDNSEVQEVTLEEELNAIRNYTDLEMQRFEEGFDFRITCEEEINLAETNLLSMLLQPFVENAIKHGISRNKCRGKILIDIRKKGNAIVVAIEDNGVGMEEASRWNQENREKHTSHGTLINLERIEAYNKVYNKSIRTRVINLTDNEGKSAGTRVEVEI